MTSIFLKTKKFMDDLISTTMPRTKQIVHEKLGYPQKLLICFFKNKKNKEV
jgi:hypothetical protein